MDEGSRSRDDERYEHYLRELSGTDRWPVSEDIFERPVRDLKRRPWVALEITETVQTALHQMAAHRIGSVVVTEAGRVAGIFTERDLLYRLAQAPLDPTRDTLALVMTRDAACLHADDTVALAIYRMSQGGHRHLPLVDAASRPIGMISVRDVVDYLAQIFPHKILTMPPDPRKIPKNREGG